MTKTDNTERIDKKFDELKTLMATVQSDMMKGVDCNNQLYLIIQTLDSITEKIAGLSEEKAQPSDEYTILQTNLLEVKKELAGLSQNIEVVINEDLRELMSTLTQKVNRLEILTNNTGLDKQAIVSAAEGVTQTISEAIENDSQKLAAELKECVTYLENTYKTVSEDAVHHLSDDITLLGLSIEKTNDNLKRSIIDLFSRIQATTDAETKNSSANQGSLDDIEMLKNGIYNLNVNTEQRFSKLNRLIEEMDIFKKLEGFSRLGGLPAIGQLKQTLNSKLNNIVDKYSYTLQTSQNREELNSATQQFRKEVYSAIVSMLGNVSEFLIDNGTTGVSGSQMHSFADKIDELTSVTELNNSGYSSVQMELKELGKRCTHIQDAVKNFNDVMMEMKNNVIEIQTRGDILKQNNTELGDIIKECATSIIENSEPDRKTIKDLLFDIKKNISILQSGDEESDYTYSMQDIESDVAKIRIYLNELSQTGLTVNTGDFSDDLNSIIVIIDSIKQQLNKIDEADIADSLISMKDDVTSISTRVNKLILTSDNSQTQLETTLKEFKSLSEDINEQIKAISSTNKFKNLEDNMTSVLTALRETNNYNSVINQSLIMLAEWVDNAGEMITDIQAKQTKLDSINELKNLFIQNSDDIVSTVKTMLDGTEDLIKELPVPVDYTSTINELESRLSQQSKLIDLQTDKISKLDEKLSTILEFMVKNDSANLADKIDEIDSKMEKLNKSIEKLTSFVNED